MSARAGIDVILVRPENPANVGAVARVMRNTGLGRLVLVAASDFRTVECWRSAWGAHDVVEAVVETPDLESALEGYDQVAAFSGRSGPDQPSLDVRDVAARLAARPAGVRTAFLFGPESAGLSEDELRRCGWRVRIPTHDDQPSLNLSHAVLVAGYELLRASAAAAGTDDEEWVGRAERQGFLRAWRSALVTAGALAEDDHRYFERWQDYFLRTPLTSRDLCMFEHLAHKLSRANDR